jgi:succinyl-diaminopimelate desuccinylase
MEDVKHYVKTHTEFPDYTLICDGKFPVCIGEKGNLSGDLIFDINADSNLIDFTGGVVGNAVPDRASMVIKADLQKVRDSLKNADVTVSAGEPGPDGPLVKIETTGTAGHAAHPEGTVNAIQKLARLVSDAGLLTGTAREAVQFIAGAFADYYGAGLNIASEDEISGKTTHIGGLIRLENGKLRQNFNSRVAIKTDPASLIPRLRELAEQRHFTIENLRNGPPRYDAPDSPQVKILVETAKQFLGEDLSAPYTTGGGTHAKHFPRSIPFGAAVPLKEGAKKKFGSAHSADEGIAIADLIQAVKIYVVALIRLDELYK